MHENIRFLCRSSFLALRSIASVRSYVTESTSTQLVSSFITSRLDYCNALLAGFPLIESGRIQRIQNNAARLVMRKSKRTHITPVLQHLHWLPISARDRNTSLPSLPTYLSSTLKTYQPSRSLRSSDEKLPKVPRINLKSFDYRSFIYQTPTVCLRQSPSLLSFKSNLKTDLF